MARGKQSGKSGRDKPALNQRRIPVVQEELAVGKREVDRGQVRVRKVVREQQETVDLPLMRQEVRIERIPINRAVEAPIPAREENGTVILSVVEEVLDVRKSLVLREEIRIHRERVEVHRPRPVTLRREEVVVERTGDGESPRPGTPGRSGQGRRKP